MAKKYLASKYEIGYILEMDLGIGFIKEDWYRQRFTAVADGVLLDEVIDLEIPFALPRDQYCDPVIPGGISQIEDPNIISTILECLGVDQNANYQFSVITGKYYHARDEEHPARFALAEPKRSRDVMLLAAWPVDTPPPVNFAEDEICDSPVLKSAYFGNHGCGYCTATWLIRAISPLGKLLTREAQQCYDSDNQESYESLKNYEQTYVEIRNKLFSQLQHIVCETSEKQPIAMITFGERYLRAEWYDADNEPCNDYFFYTEIGAESVIDLARSWLLVENSTFAIQKEL